MYFAMSECSRATLTESAGIVSMRYTIGLRRWVHLDQRGVRAWIAAVLAIAATATVSVFAAGDPLVAKALANGIRLDAIKRSAESALLTGPPPLVRVDDEMVGYLRKSAEQIKEGKYDQAIGILQALIQRPEGGFYAESGSRFVSMRLKATEMVGAMGPKGLKLYRALYDPQAKRLYEEAMASDQPEFTLRRLCERYLHTNWGPKALETLAEIHFDRSRFSQAIACWRQLLACTDAGPRKGELLARISAAYTLAGEQTAANRLAEEIRKDYANVSVDMGGRSEKLTAFLARIEKLGPQASIDPQTAKGWPGLGGVPDGLGRMGECDVVLEPRWPKRDPLELSKDLIPQLQAGGAMYLAGVQTNPYSSSRQPARRDVSLKSGHLLLTSTTGGSASRSSEMVLPSMLHPVIANGRVFVRTEDRVLSLDFLTGGDKWESVALPMVRKLPALPNRGVYYGGGQQYIGDNGRYAMTAGGDKLFTVYDFLPNDNSLRYINRGNIKIEGLDSGSRLAALSMSGQCMVLWRVGRGEGDHEVLRNGMFLMAPTYASGRVYALVQYLQSYVLVCLDGDTGKMFWQRPVAQIPVVLSGYSSQLGADGRLAIGSPPAVADGRVYVTTNSGVVASFDAATGEPLWGYQYDSKVNNTNTTISRSYIYGGRAAVWEPGNPMIVSRGLVVCLPADSGAMLGLDCETGELRWSKSRRGQFDLAAIDAERVLLSGQGLFVYRISDGLELAQGPEEDMNIHGRPAVTSRRVLASSLGKVYSMDLDTYEVSGLDLTSPRGVLGNLVSADGKLFSGSMLGVSAYFSYEVAREALSHQIDTSQPETQAPLVLQRAQLSFDARKFDLALQDLLKCRKLTAAHKDDTTEAQLPHLLYRTYVALGNHADSDAEMEKLFEKALTSATTVQQKAHMKLRMAKLRERMGRFAEAAGLAQDIAEEYGKEEMVEVEIGPQADESVRFSQNIQTLPGRKIADDYIRELIEKYGRDCYASFDAKAQAAIAEARKGGKPEDILAVATRWPNSVWADDSLFFGAEACYLRAQADPNGADVDLGNARRCLHRVTKMPESPLRLSAKAALAVIYARGQWATSARREIAALREQDGETLVSFADIKGRLSDVLRQIETTGGESARKPMAQLSIIRPPLVEKFTIKGETAHVLCDQNYRPLRIEDRVVMIDDGDALMLNVAGDQGQAEWKTPAGVDKTTNQRYAYLPPGMRLIGALSRDGRTVVVADRKSARGMDVVTGKTKWHTDFDKVGIKSFYCMGAGQGVLAVADTGGKVCCLDLANGKLLWQNTLVGGRSRMPLGAPQIGGGLVFFRSDSGKSVTAMSLAREGRVVATWTAKQWSQVEINADGIVLMLLDGELTAREPSRIDKPLWKVEYDGVKNPTIIGVSTEMLALAPDMSGGDVELLSIPGGGRKVASLTTARIEGQAGIAFDAVFDREGVFLLCTAGLNGRRAGQYGQITNTRGINLQKFNSGDGKRLWSRDLENASVYYSNVLPVTVGTNHVVISARHFQSGRSCYVHVIESKTGREAQKIQLGSAKIASQNETRRRQAMGPPVMTAGRLVVETAEGVSVNGEK